MALNQLHHGYTLSALKTEITWARVERRWSRYGRNGETNGGAWIQDARKRYNKAHRKASRVQLSCYQAHVEECHPGFAWEAEDDWTWDDLRTDEDEWYEEKRFNERFYASQDLDWEYSQG